MNTGSPGGKVGETVVVGGEIGDGGVVVLHPSTLTESDLHSSDIQRPPRKRTRMSEEALSIRREKIANRMRMKRANESNEQKEKRRIREAERMRKKRALEDEEAKEKRRKEAADRARQRRAKLTSDEREEERKKAAIRMRLKRQNEDENQKQVRRMKAAERMRRRRAIESPADRAKRRSAKTKRKNGDTDDSMAEGSPLKIVDNREDSNPMLSHSVKYDERGETQQMKFSVYENDDGSPLLLSSLPIELVPAKSTSTVISSHVSFFYYFNF